MDYNIFKWCNLEYVWPVVMWFEMLNVRQVRLNTILLGNGNQEDLTFKFGDVSLGILWYLNVSPTKLVFYNLFYTQYFLVVLK